MDFLRAMKQDLKIYKKLSKKLKMFLIGYDIENSCLSDIVVDITGIGRFEEHGELTVELCNVTSSLATIQRPG